jgi:septum formation protein
MFPSLILASQSPRRHELLTQLGYQFQAVSADIDESIYSEESAEKYVTRLAIEKAQVVASLVKNKSLNTDKNVVVLGSDTSVVLEGHILGKPQNIEQCREYLQRLSGKKHQVFTAIAAVSDNKTQTQLVTTDVYFKTLTLEEIDRYWRTGEPQDKAGAYGIQGIGGQFVKQINGSYSAVVGLPLYETAQLLAKFDLPTAIQKTKEEQ